MWPAPNKSRKSTLRSHRYSSSTVCKIDASQAMSWASIRRRAQARVQRGFAPFQAFIPGRVGLSLTTQVRARRPPCMLELIASSSSVFLFSSSFFVPVGVAAVAAQRKKKRFGCRCERRLQGYKLVILKQGLACLGPSRTLPARSLAERPRALLALWLGCLPARWATGSACSGTSRGLDRIGQHAS